jgi:peptidoglycan/xylan/chitin deacetylase (PgdA/CDA1 family)
MAQIYLTFDDGPDPEFTPRILDALSAADMHATFFIVGANARRWPQLVRRAAQEGHVIANHSLSHRHPWWMTSRRARQEVRGGADAITDVLGSAAKHFRPPHGRVRACMSDEAQACGQSVVLWDVSATDWGPFGRAPRIAQRLERIQANDIVLMHDARNEHNRPDELLRVLPAMLERLRQRGWRSAPLS